MNLLPLTSIIIEPAKVLFLNNAINHGVLTPLGIQQAATEGSSILFLLEANPGPGVGLLLAFTFFGIGAARASAPGAAVIQFFGGIHEVYFPYALMKPMVILALIAGGATGVTTNMLLGGALRAPAAPGSIIAVLAQTATGSYFAVILSVILAAAVTFVLTGLILRASRKRDLEAMAATDDAFGAAITQTEAAKGKSSDALGGLRGGAATAAGGGIDPRRHDRARDQEHRVRVRRGHGLVGDGRERAAQQDQEGGHRRRHGRQQGDRGLDGSADLVITQQPAHRPGAGSSRRTRCTCRSTTS